MSNTIRARSLAAVIVEYNSGELLGRALDSILAQSEPISAITVVANSSVNRAELETRDPRISVLTSTNVGYGAAVNRGVRSTPPECDVIVMNPDISLDPKAAQQMMSVLRSDSRVGAVGPRLLWPDGSMQRACSRFPTPADELVQQTRLRDTSYGRKRLRRLWLSDWDRQVGRNVDVLSGACLLLRRQAFDEVGGFDERYFLYFEEVDLCQRLARTGWKRWYCSDARAVHLSGGSSEGGAIAKWYAESRRRYMMSYYPTVYAGVVEATLRAYDAARLDRDPTAVAEHRSAC